MGEMLCRLLTDEIIVGWADPCCNILFLVCRGNGNVAINIHRGGAFNAKMSQV